jgi:hypothetical protein
VRDLDEDTQGLKGATSLARSPSPRLPPIIAPILVSPSPPSSSPHRLLLVSPSPPHLAPPSHLPPSHPQADVAPPIVCYGIAVVATFFAGLLCCVLTKVPASAYQV